MRIQRDNQQSMLDLALNMRGRVQNFERDDLEVPPSKRACNYRMLPKVTRQIRSNVQSAKGRCGSIALIDDPGVIRRILEHLRLWAPLATERSVRLG